MGRRIVMAWSSLTTILGGYQWSCGWCDAVGRALEVSAGNLQGERALSSCRFQIGTPLRSWPPALSLPDR